MAGEPNLAVERVTGWSKPQSSRLVLPTYNWRYDTKQLADQRLPDGSDAAAELASILQIPSANIIGLYPCSTASPLTSLVGGAPNLVAAGGPLVQRAANGLLYKGRRTGKLACEILNGGADTFVSAAPFMAVPLGVVRAFLVVFRVNPNATAPGGLVGNNPAPGCFYSQVGPANIFLYAWPDGGAPTVIAQLGGLSLADGAWHGGAFTIRGTTRTGAIFSDVGNNDPGTVYANAALSGGTFGIGKIGGAFVVNAGVQVAYLACFDIEITAAMFNRFWTHGSRPSALTAYTRANTVRTACAASAVSAWSANQYATRYAATFAARRNWRLEGIANDGPVTFEPIGSTDFYGNSGVVGGAARASVDGVSGMRDGMRVTMSALWLAGGYVRTTPAGVPIAGASNVPWRGDVWYRRATTGTAARMALWFSGDPGGAETFTLITDNATPTQWTRGGGTCTPVRPAHNIFEMFTGADNNPNDCDFADPAVIKNCSVAPDWWVLTGLAAAVAQNPAAITVSNAADAVLDHAQGSLRIRTAGYGGQGLPAWDVTPRLFSCVAGGSSLVGLVQLYRDAAVFGVQFFDAAGASAFQFLAAGATLRDGNDHLILFDWCASAPVAYVAGVPWYAALYFDGVLQGVGGGTAPTNPWVPAVGGTIYVEDLQGGFGAAAGRAAVEEVTIFPNPSRLLGTAPVVL